MDGTTAERTASGRLLTVCALLLGLFLMHGAPAAAGGCHAVMTRTTAATSPAGMHDGPAHAAGPAAPGPSAQREGHDGAAGGQCVSTPAQTRAALAPPPLLAVLPLLALVTRSLLRLPAGSVLRRRRGPPTPGRVLLTQVCISRT
ncbi:hypothetical protein [Kitasatospora sp. NPDC059571]|uniref:hypothetical protein n=1 Tax=Kitasatospora sp. NPDC059571 TaxID=3346871 RepID=UPI0036CA4066